MGSSTGRARCPIRSSESLVADETMALGEVLPDGSIPELDETLHDKPENQWLEMWRSLIANRTALVSLIFIAFLVLVAVFGPYLTPYNPIETNMANALKTPERCSTGSVRTSWAWTSSAA